jgi:hypothetical protein
LGTDDGTFGSGQVSSGGPSLPSYPHRDANLVLNNSQAWQTLLLTHWGNADWITNAYDYAHFLDALAVNIELTSGRRYAGLLEAVYARLATGAYDYSPSDSLDTPAFMALGLGHLYTASAGAQVALPHRQQLLALAQNYLTPVVAAEATDGNNNSLGLYWDASHSSRRTAGNAAAVLAALQLYGATADGSLLVFAKRIYGAWLTAAVDGNTWAVADGAAINGSLDPTAYTHNAGLMVGAAVALHGATGESHYLKEARSMAAALVNTFGQSTDFGTVLTEPMCSSASCGVALVYRGLALRALAQLGAIDGSNSAVQGVLNGTAAAIVASRNASTGHYAVSWPVPGTSTQDTAADLAVALSLGYLSLSAPQQVPATVGGTTAIAAEAALGNNLPILPGGDGQGGWATAGIFTASDQALTASLWAPFTGAYTLSVRYAVPDTSAPFLAVALSPNVSSSVLSLSPTGSTQVMLTTSGTAVVLNAGLNTVTFSPSVVPANAQLDVIVAASAHTVSGAACGPSSTLVPLAPVAGDRLCGVPTFSWKGGSGTAGRSDVLVDGQVACTVQGTAQTCTPAGAPASGRHVWQVVEDGCSPSPLQSFDVSGLKPTAPTASLSAQGTDTLVTWAAATDGQRFDVSVNGTLVCAGLTGHTCLVQAASLAAAGQNTLTLTATNSCGQVSANQTF